MSTHGRGKRPGSTIVGVRVVDGHLRAVPPRDNQGLGGPRLPVGDPVSVSVTCWCEHEVVRVPPRDIINGRTVSCGRPTCKALD